MLHVNVKTADLLKSANLTISVSEKKSNLPILSHFLLEAVDNSLIVSASDLDTTIRETCPAVVYSPGKLTVPARTFHSMIRAVNSDSISLREGEKLTLEFTSGSFKTVFFGLAAESFPKQTDSTDVSFRWLPSNALIDAIDKVVYSVAARDERYNLSGIYMVLEELEDQKFLRLVSSDSKRLNISTVIDSAQDFNLDRGVIMSKKGVQELRRLAETVTELEIGVAFTSVIAKTPSTVLDVHLLEGGFPDYRLVVPKDYDKSVEISRVGFLEALKRLAHLCDETVKVAKFEFSNIGLHVLIVNANIGQAEETIPMTYDGETLTTGFNVSYFLEALSNLKSAMVKLEFMTPDLSFLLTGEDDPGYFGIVMTSTYNF